jgi:hypothetical protein
VQRCSVVALTLRPSLSRTGSSCAVSPLRLCVLAPHVETLGEPMRGWGEIRQTAALDQEKTKTPRDTTLSKTSAAHGPRPRHQSQRQLSSPHPGTTSDREPAVQARKHVLRAKFDLAFGAHSSKAIHPACTLAVHIASRGTSDLLQTHTHPIPRGAKASEGTSFFISFASNCMHGFRAQMFGMPVPERNECCGDFVRVRLVAHNCDRGTSGPFAYQGELCLRRTLELL